MKRIGFGFGARIIPLILLAMLPGQQTTAQVADSLSPSLVLVLKLVSATRVQPVTGIVVSSRGLVMVPAGFIADGGEFVVLDGGTDIISNGRPATVNAQSVTGKTALLAVDGLSRPTILLSDDGMNNVTNLRFQAFPPAQLIARGAQPLQESLTEEKPLPYVTGAVLNRCGQLVALSVASGVQSLDSNQQPTIIDARELNRELESMHLSVPVSVCAAPVPQRDEVKAEATSVETAPELQVPDHESREDETTEPDLTKLNANKPGPDKADPGKAEQQTPGLGDSVTESEKLLEPAQHISTGAAGNITIWGSVPWWIWVTGLLGFTILGAKIASLLHTSRVQPASDEPDTRQLAPVTDPIPAPRSGHVDNTVMPDTDELPVGCDAFLVLEGLQQDGEVFRRFCAVDSREFSIVIGRGKSDICIEHAAISRSHVRIEGTYLELTLSDLDSSNGTFVKGVPCLPGEILYFEPGDEIVLGDIPLRAQLIRKEGAES